MENGVSKEELVPRLVPSPTGLFSDFEVPCPSVPRPLPDKQGNGVRHTFSSFPVFARFKRLECHSPGSPVDCGPSADTRASRMSAHGLQPVDISHPAVGVRALLGGKTHLATFLIAGRTRRGQQDTDESHRLDLELSRGLNSLGLWAGHVGEVAAGAKQGIPSAQRGNRGTDGYVLAQVLERGHRIPNTNAGLLDSLPFHVPSFGINFRAVDENSGRSLPPDSPHIPACRRHGKQSCPSVWSLALP